MGMDQKRFVGIAHYVSRRDRQERNGLDTWFRICHIGLGARIVSQVVAKPTHIFPSYMNRSGSSAATIVSWAKEVKKK